jgi:GNAT superfamily N-acetyltransferase
MTIPIAIRRATLADFGRVLAIWNASLRTLAATHYERAAIEVHIVQLSPLLNEVIARERGFVADCGGVLVGWGAWSARESARAWLTSNLCVPPPHSEVGALYIDPAWTRRGFGRRLLTAIEDDMVANGHRQADLIATLNSVAFFKAHGYADGTLGEAKLPPSVTFRWLDMTKVLVPMQSTLATAA